MAGRTSIAGSNTGIFLNKMSLNCPIGIRDKNKIIESTVKSETKISSLNKGSPTQDISDKSTKDYVKVPTIKKKV